MNRKQLSLLIVIAAVLGVLGWVVWRKQQAAYGDSTQKMGKKVLPNFPLNDVEQITIKQPDAELHLAKVNDLWAVKERGNYAANFSNIKDLLSKLWELKVAKPVKAGPTRLPALELSTPLKGSGTQLEFKDKSGKVISTVVLGAKSVKQAGNDSPFGGGGSWPDGRYLMVGSDLQSVALVTEPFANIEAKPPEWLNKDWFKVEKLKSVSVVATNATNNWSISRESETGEWKLADAKPGEALDTGKSSGAASALSFPSFNDVATNASPETTGIGQGVSATLTTFDGFTYAVKIGNKSGEENYFFQFAIAGDFPKERAPGKDEKAEDKEKLDKEFKERKQKLEEKLKADKAFEKWAYVVSKWTIDPFLKDRKDLLAEKKEEPKPAEKTEAKPEFKIDAKPAAATETKPDAKPETKPAAK